MWPIINQFGKAAGAVGGYLGGIAREARDIPTAIGTNLQIGRFGGANAMQGKPLDVAGNRNIVNQVKEVGGALLGLTGTPSAQYNPKSGFTQTPMNDSRIIPGKPVADPASAFGTRNSGTANVKSNSNVKSNIK